MYEIIYLNTISEFFFFVFIIVIIFFLIFMRQQVNSYGMDIRYQLTDIESL